MKPFLQHCIGISIVLLAIGFLFRSIHPAFAENHGAETGTAETNPGSKILWINIDTVDVKYKAFTDLADSAQRLYNSKMEDYRRKSVDLQNRYQALQEKILWGLISTSDAEAEQKAIRNETDKLQLEESEIGLLEQNAMKKNEAITADVTSFLEEFSLRKNADYVLGYGSSSNVLYANTALDVTNEVVDELNKRYREKKQTK